MASSTPLLQPPTPSSNDQHPIAQQLAALQAQKLHTVSPSQPPLSPPKKTRLPWTGFTGKTLWDWLTFLVQLLGALAIPLVIFLASSTITMQQQQAADANRKNDLQIADDQRQETTLKTYLDDMSNLLLNNQLHNASRNDEVRNVARIKTLTTTRQLNGPHKGLLLLFLYEAGLLHPPTSIIDLGGADLSGANLSDTYPYAVGVSLYSINLDGVNLSGAKPGLFNFPPKT